MEAVMEKPTNIEDQEIISFSNSNTEVVIVRHADHENGKLTEKGISQAQLCAGEILDHYQDFDGKINIRFDYSPVIVPETGEIRTQNTGFEIIKELLSDPRVVLHLPNRRKSIDQGTDDGPDMQVYKEYLQKHPDLKIKFDGDHITLWRNTTTESFPGLEINEKTSSTHVANRIERTINAALNIEKNNPNILNKDEKYLLILITHDDAISPFLMKNGYELGPTELIDKANPIFCKLESNQLKTNYVSRSSQANK